MMSFTCLICINVSPMLSPDKIKNKLLGRLYKAFCDLGTTVLPRTHPQTCWVHVPMLPWLRLFSQAGGLPSTMPLGKAPGFLQAQTKYHSVLEASPGSSVRRYCSPVQEPQNSIYSTLVHSTNCLAMWIVWVSGILVPFALKT